MPLPEIIRPEIDQDELCVFARKWGVSQELAARIVHGASRLEFRVQIISGHRTPEEQVELGRRGRPTAPVDVSTHTSCPATGADLRPLTAVTNVVKARLGTEMHLAGLRWGGGSAIDPETGIPSDWNHFDLGPRHG